MENASCKGYEKTCAECGKQFIIYGLGDYIYKKIAHKTIDGKHSVVTKYYCSYTCIRKSEKGKKRTIKVIR